VPTASSPGLRANSSTSSTENRACPPRASSKDRSRPPGAQTGRTVTVFTIRHLSDLVGLSRGLFMVDLFHVPVFRASPSGAPRAPETPSHSSGGQVSQFVYIGFVDSNSKKGRTESGDFWFNRLQERGMLRRSTWIKLGVEKRDERPQHPGGI